MHFGQSILFGVHVTGEMRIVACERSATLDQRFVMQCACAGARIPRFGKKRLAIPAGDYEFGIHSC